MTIGEWASQGAKVGLDAIDLSILFFKNRDQSYLVKEREEIRSFNMDVAIVNTYPDFTHPDSRERIRQSNQLKKDIATAAALGASFVRVTAGQAHPQTKRRDGIKWAIEGLVSSIDTAEYHGIKLVYENHSKPGCWEYSDFSHPTDIFLEIADNLSDTCIGILFDTANPIAYGDNPLSILEKVIERVICIHAADTKTFGALEPVIIGTGMVPFYEIFTILKKSGFDGVISIEEASRLGRLGVQKAVKFVRETWEKAK